MSTSNIPTHDPAYDPNNEIYDPNSETYDSNNENQVSNNETPWCSSCKKFKPVIEFMRPSGRSIKIFATCNDCAEKDRIRKKGKRQRDTSPDRTSADAIDSETHEDDLIYNLSGLEELIAIKFRDEELNANVKFTVTVDIEKVIIDNDALSLESGQDMETKKFHAIAKTLLIPLQEGSGYYWEIRNLYPNIKDGQYIGCATARLCCTQRLEPAEIFVNNREYKNPNNQPAQCISEAQPAIQRFLCEGVIKIEMDLCEQKAIISVKHLAHERPTYRETRLPDNALIWIQQNINNIPRKVEFYKRFCNENLLNPSIHTYHQVYYWVNKFSVNQYMTDVENQLNSVKNFLEQRELIDEGYKIILYYENEFVRALGFTTPFLQAQENITEIVIHVLHQENGSQIQVGILTEFFKSLCNEHILPAFVLLDKDAGEIAAVRDAWSQTTVIHLCLWHMKCAIRRKLKETKV
ncbi:2984_t:CDS:2, partial [Cetraspora pellucida]